MMYGEFFDLKEIDVAQSLLNDGLTRAGQLMAGQAPWTIQTGPVTRGDISKIDGSVQPYGLVIPESFTTGAMRWRLDVWFHGRGEQLSKVKFLNQRRQDKGQFTPPQTIVLHPYGRYCNANKLGGEIDTLEAIQSIPRWYVIDEDRIAVRGFSMGGAACWQFAVHYTDHWTAAAPGAGFSETPGFLTFYQKEILEPTWYEKKLWRMYDCTDYAVNLAQLPIVAYSGDRDVQKQAADAMAVAMKKEGIDLVHIIGPETGYSYHAAAKAEIDRRIDSILSVGRNRMPQEIRFTTPTLRYNQMHWLTVDGLSDHWTPARVEAKILHIPNDHPAIRLSVRNVTALTLSFPPGLSPINPTSNIQVMVTDGEQQTLVAAPRVGSDRSWLCPLSRGADGKWKMGAAPTGGPVKKHGSQGPIDDAFLDSFVFVKPSGNAAHQRIEN